MSEEKQKRQRRVFTKEEKKVMYEAKIKEYEDKIAELKGKIAALEEPVVTANDIRNKIKEIGISNADVMKLLEKLEKK